MNYMDTELGIWEISVLAMLREIPMHPYQMQRLLRLRHKDEILALKRGSLYHSIRRLKKQGLIAVETTGREGKRPERTVYRILPAGQEAFMNTLRKIVATPRRGPSEFMAAVSFIVHLDPKDAIRLLKERAEKLEAEIAHRTAGLAVASTHVARINLIESEYLVSMLRAELAWVQAMKDEMEQGNLVWDIKTILRHLWAGNDTAVKRR